MGMLVPEAYGGAGADYVSYALAIEELARVDAGTAVTLSVHSMICSAIGKLGTQEQKERWLPLLGTGDVIAGFALTESDAGSDAAAIRATAKRSSGGYVLDGRKQWCTSGSYAGVIMGMFRTGGPGARGVSAFLIESNLPGISVERVTEKLGIHTSNTCDLAFDGVEVGEDARLGDEGAGFGNAMTALTAGRIGIAAQAIGILAACLDESVQFAKERVAFGKPIGAFEGVSFKIAQMAMDLDAARLLIYRAAALADAGESFGLAASKAKLFASTRRAQTRRRSGADPRRLRIHQRVSSRASLSRREDHRNIRRHVGDPTAHHRALATGPARLAGRGCRSLCYHRLRLN